MHGSGGQGNITHACHSPIAHGPCICLALKHGAAGKFSIVRDTCVHLEPGAIGAWEIGPEHYIHSRVLYLHYLYLIRVTATSDTDLWGG